MTDQIKRSNTHEIKVNIETDDNLSEFIKQKIDEKFDEKIPNLRTKQTMEQFKWSLMRIEDKQEILDDNIESVHKWATYFKSALMLTLFAVLLISVVATFMGGLFNVLGFDHMYKGLEYQIKLQTTPLNILKAKKYHIRLHQILKISKKPIAAK